MSNLKFGITHIFSLFGPRRKMMSAITRSVSEIRNVVVSRNTPEMSYADAVNSKLAKLQERMKEVSYA